MPHTALNLLDTEFPVFEEATQTASRFLNMPICTVGIPNGNALVLKAAIGLSQLGLMNPLARTRRFPLDDELANYVLREKRCLVLPTIDQDPFVSSLLVQEYGIQAFLGMPLLTAEGACIGLLAAMDVQPREFAGEAIAFMELLARWSVSEYERYDLSLKLANGHPAPLPPAETTPVAASSLLDTVRLTLMSQLTQDMRNPLTTITGMANMLSREIYGPLTPKQREYAEIVRNSSQNLLEVANEILELSSIGSDLQPLNPTPVDFEMLGQYVQKTLTTLAQENHQDLQITVEPGSRLWRLDKDVVRQLLYHLTYSIIKLSGEGGTVRIHGSERDDCLNIAIWVSHPWLGEGVPASASSLYRCLSNTGEETNLLSLVLAQATGNGETAQFEPPCDNFDDIKRDATVKVREILSLLLSRHLIEHHGGTLTLQGTAESGYRFLVILPSA